MTGFYAGLAVGLAASFVVYVVACLVCDARIAARQSGVSLW